MGDDGGAENTIHSTWRDDGDAITTCHAPWVVQPGPRRENLSRERHAVRGPVSKESSLDRDANAQPIHAQDQWSSWQTRKRSLGLRLHECERGFSHLEGALLGGLRLGLG